MYALEHKLAQMKAESDKLLRFLVGSREAENVRYDKSPRGALTANTISMGKAIERLQRSARAERIGIPALETRMASLTAALQATTQAAYECPILDELFTLYDPTDTKGAVLLELKEQLVPALQLAKKMRDWAIEKLGPEVMELEETTVAGEMFALEVQEHCGFLQDTLEALQRNEPINLSVRMQGMLSVGRRMIDLSRWYTLYQSSEVGDALLAVTVDDADKYTAFGWF